MPSTAQGFCEEFCNSLDPSRYSTGNWFGRLLAFKYKIFNFFGDEYSEEDFRAKIADGSIVIKSISAPANINVSFSNDTSLLGLITGTFDVEAEVDGVMQSATFSFEHEVKWSIHATKTTLTEV